MKRIIVVSTLIFSCIVFMMMGTSCGNSGEAYRKKIEAAGPSFGVQGWDYIISHEDCKDFKLKERYHFPKCEGLFNNFDSSDFEDLEGISCDVFVVEGHNGYYEEIYLWYKEGEPQLALFASTIKKMSKARLLSNLHTAWGNHLKAYQLQQSLFYY